MPQALETFAPGSRICIPKQYPEDARWTAGRFTASQSLAAGTLVGKVTATGLLSAYNNANVNGTETAVGILMYSIDVDASGNVFLGGSAVASSMNQPTGKTAPYYVSGTFDPADITGEDAAGITDLNGITLANGYIKFG